MKTVTLTSKQQKIQNEIDALLAKGMVVEVEQDPCMSKQTGMYCDCCGRDGMRIIEVYAYEQGKKSECDPMSQLSHIFGPTCIKKFRFTKAEAPKAEAPKAKAKKAPKAEARPNSFDEYLVRIEALLADMEQDAKTYDQVEGYKTALMLLNHNISKKMIG